MGGSKLDANTYLKWITFKCKSTAVELHLKLTQVLHLKVTHLEEPEYA